MNYDVINHVAKVQELLSSGNSFGIVSLLDIRGSAPQVVGAKAIVTSRGIEAGTIGGGKIEAAAIAHAQELIRDLDANPQLVTWNLQTDIGMTCGGEVKLFFETHTTTQWPIAVFGAGHVSQALIPMLLQLNCKVTCIDSRNEWLGKFPDHPKLEKVCPQSLKEQVADQPPNTFFVLMSKGHGTDLPVLEEILKTRNPPYVGVIGSKQKASVLRRDLKEKGLSEEKLNSYFCPMGLPLGNNTPTEIAISVVAQLIQTRDQLGIFQHNPKQF